MERARITRVHDPHPLTPGCGSALDFNNRLLSTVQEALEQVDQEFLSTCNRTGPAAVAQSHRTDAELASKGIPQ